MIYSAPRPDHPQPPSVYIGITNWAAGASRQILATMTLVGSATAATLLVADWHRLPLAALLITISSVGGWGLLQQAASRPRSRSTMVGQAVLPRWARSRR